MLADRIIALRFPAKLREANITHVLSILAGPVDNAVLAGFQDTLQVPVNDLASENLIRHFPATNAFIRRALHGSGTVLVHWSVASPCPPPRQKRGGFARTS